MSLAFSDPDSETAILRLITSRLWSSLEPIDKAAAVLRPEDFAVPMHAAVYGTALALHADGQPVDLLTIQERLGEAQLRSFGSGTLGNGMAALTRLLTLGDDHLAPALLPDCCRRIAELSRKRRLYRALSETLESAGALTPDEILSQLERQIEPLRESSAGAVESFSQLAGRMEDYFEGRLCGRETIPTGFAQLDRILRLEPGHLAVVGAYTSVGKTAFACFIACTAVRKEIAFGFLSLEMEAEEIGARLVALLGSFAADAWSPGNYITEDQRRILRDSIAKLEQLDSFLTAPRDFRLAKVRSAVADMAKRGARLVIIDYLQLIKADLPKNSKREEVLDVSRALKLMARENHIAIIALAQLRREAETSGHPSIHHLQESASIEQDADSIILLHRPQKGEILDGWVEEAAAKLDKNRHGQTGCCRIGFHRRLGAFVELGEEEEA